MLRAVKGQGTESWPVECKGKTNTGHCEPFGEELTNKKQTRKFFAFLGGFF